MFRLHTSKPLACRAMLLLAALLTALTAGAQADSASLLQRANAAYAAGEYPAAIELYQQVLADEGAAAEVYYNLGNACYKTNQTGASILNYERALRLRPHYADARFNLQMARSRVVDNVDLTSHFFLRNWVESLRNLLSADSWALISIISFLLTLGLFFLFAFARRSGLKKTGFYLGLLMLLLAVASLLFGYSQYRRQTLRPEAVIMQSSVSVKSSPDDSGTDLFMLHEGTEVNITDQVGSWYNIHLADGNQGWLQEGCFERI